MGYIVQSIVFDKNKGWDLTTAREWVKNHKEFSKPIKEEETTNTIRVRLFPPKKAKQMGFKDYRMKTLASGDVGIMLDIAYNKMKGGMVNDDIQYEELHPIEELRNFNSRVNNVIERIRGNTDYMRHILTDPNVNLTNEQRTQISNEVGLQIQRIKELKRQIDKNNEKIKFYQADVKFGSGMGSSKVAVTNEEPPPNTQDIAFEENTRLFAEGERLEKLLVNIEKKLKKRMELRKRVLLEAERDRIIARLQEIENEMEANNQILTGGMNGFSVSELSNFREVNPHEDVPLSIAIPTDGERDYNLPRLTEIVGEKNPLRAERVVEFYNLPRELRDMIRYDYEGFPRDHELPTAVGINPNSRRAFERFDPDYFYEVLGNYLNGHDDERSRNSALPHLTEDEQMINALRSAIRRENTNRRGRRRRGEDDEIDNITLDFDDDVSVPANNRGKPLTPAQERDADEYETLLQIPFNDMTTDTKKRFRKLENKVFGRNRPFLQRLFGNGIGGSLSSEDLEALLAKSYNSQNPSDYKDFQVDKDLSGQRVQVYHNPTTQQTIVAHRGTASVPNWIENVAYAVGNDKSGKAFQHSKKIQDQAYTKYGKENITTIGHSKGALHAQEYGKEGKEVITLNKPVNIHDALFTRVPKSQTDIRTQYDPVSFLRPFQRGNKAETIKSTTKNPLEEHKTSVLGRLDPRRLFGGALLPISDDEEASVDISNFTNLYKSLREILLENDEGLKDDYEFIRDFNSPAIRVVYQDRIAGTIDEFHWEKDIRRKIDAYLKNPNDQNREKILEKIGQIKEHIRGDITNTIEEWGEHEEGRSLGTYDDFPSPVSNSGDEIEEGGAIIDTSSPTDPIFVVLYLLGAMIGVPLTDRTIRYLYDLYQNNRQVIDDVLTDTNMSVSDSSSVDNNNNNNNNNSSDSDSSSDSSSEGDIEEGRGMTGGIFELPHFDADIGRLFRGAKRRWAKSPKMIENIEYERKLFDAKYGKLMRYTRLVAGQGELDNTTYVELLMYSNWVKDLEIPEISKGAGKKAKKVKK